MSLTAVAWVPFIHEMAVVVRRWSLPEEDGGENTCRFQRSSTDIEVDAVQSEGRGDSVYSDKGASVSLDHKYLVVTKTADSSRSRRTLQLDLWLLRELYLTYPKVLG